MKQKKISKAGGLTIPADVRRYSGFESGTAVDIKEQNGNLIIAPHTPKCMFCENENGVKVFKDKRVCTKCVAEMRALIDG